MGRPSDDEIDDFGTLFQQEDAPSNVPPASSSSDSEKPPVPNPRVDDATLVAGATPATFSTRRRPTESKSLQAHPHLNLGETMDSNVPASGSSSSSPVPIPAGRPPQDVGELGNQLIEFNFISVQEWYEALHGAEDPQSIPSVLAKLQECPSATRENETVLTSYQAERIAGSGVEDLVYDHYRIIDRLGAGGMGDVLRARHVDNPKLIVAIKTISPRLLQNWDMLERFKREINFLTGLDARYFPQIHHVGKHNDLPYFAMTYVRGYTLNEMVKKAAGKPLAVELLVKMFAEIAEAIQKAHDQNLVHRDIKSSNIMVTRDGHPMILDFGIAGAVENAQAKEPEQEKTRLTMVGGGVGTPEFMPPEQFFGDEPPTFASDVYSLGVTLFHAVTGQIPFSANTVREIQQKHISDVRPRPSAYRPGLPKKLERVILKCLAVDPQARYPSMTELAQALRKSTVPFPWKTIAAAVFVVGITAGATFAALWSRPNPTPPVPTPVDSITSSLNRISDSLGNAASGNENELRDVVAQCKDLRETQELSGQNLALCQAYELLASAPFADASDLMVRTEELLATMGDDVDLRVVVRDQVLRFVAFAKTWIEKILSSDGPKTTELALRLFDRILPADHPSLQPVYCEARIQTARGLIVTNPDKAAAIYGEVVRTLGDDTPTNVKDEYRNHLKGMAAALVTRYSEATEAERDVETLGLAQQKYVDAEKQATSDEQRAELRAASAAIQLFLARDWRPQEFLVLFRENASRVGEIFHEQDLSLAAQRARKAIDDQYYGLGLSEVDPRPLSGRAQEAYADILRAAFHGCKESKNKLVLEPKNSTKHRKALNDLLITLDSQIQELDKEDPLKSQSITQECSELYLWRGLAKLTKNWLYGEANDDAATDLNRFRDGEENADRKQVVTYLLSLLGGLDGGAFAIEQSKLASVHQLLREFGIDRVLLEKLTQTIEAQREGSWSDQRARSEALQTIQDLDDDYLRPKLLALRDATGLKYQDSIATFKEIKSKSPTRDQADHELFMRAATQWFGVWADSESDAVGRLAVLMDAEGFLEKEMTPSLRTRLGDTYLALGKLYLVSDTVPDELTALLASSEGQGNDVVSVLFSRAEEHDKKEAAGYLAFWTALSNPTSARNDLRDPYSQKLKEKNAIDQTLQSSLLWQIVYHALFQPDTNAEHGQKTLQASVDQLAKAETMGNGLSELDLALIRSPKHRPHVLLLEWIAREHLLTQATVKIQIDLDEMRGVPRSSWDSKLISDHVHPCHQALVSYEKNLDRLYAIGSLTSIDSKPLEDMRKSIRTHLHWQLAFQYVIREALARKLSPELLDPSIFLDLQPILAKMKNHADGLEAVPDPQQAQWVRDQLVEMVGLLASIVLTDPFHRKRLANPVVENYAAAWANVLDLADALEGRVSSTDTLRDIRRFALYQLCRYDKDWTREAVRKRYPAGGDLGNLDILTLAIEFEARKVFTTADRESILRSISKLSDDEKRKAERWVIEFWFVMLAENDVEKQKVGNAYLGVNRPYEPIRIQFRPDSGGTIDFSGWANLVHLEYENDRLKFLKRVEAAAAK